MDVQTYLSVVLLPSQADNLKLIDCSHSICWAAKSSIKLGPDSLAHLTITRFVAPESALGELQTDMRSISTSIATLLSGGLRFTPDPIDNKTWVDIQFLKPTALSLLQSEIATLPFAQKYPIHNKQSDAYLPHCTLALLEGKSVPPIELAGFDLFRRPFTDLRLAVGVNGENLTLVSAQII